MRNGSMTVRTAATDCIARRSRFLVTTGLLVDITRVFTEREIDIDAIHSKTSKQGVATIDVSFSTKGREELGSVIDKLRQIDSVIDIVRTTG